MTVRPWTPVLAALALGLAACNADDTSSGATSTSSPLASSTTTPASTDPATTELRVAAESTPPPDDVCHDVATVGYVGPVWADDVGGIRIFATEGRALGNARVETDAPECQVDDVPPAIDALVASPSGDATGEWVGLVTEPAPQALGPGGPVPLPHVVVPVWFEPCDGEPILAGGLRIRLAGDVSIELGSLDRYDNGQPVEIVVGCDGVMSPIRVGRPFTFRGYG